MDVNKANKSDGAVPLYIACKNGHEQIADLLRAAGCDIDNKVSRSWHTRPFIPHASVVSVDLWLPWACSSEQGHRNLGHFIVSPSCTAQY